MADILVMENTGNLGPPEALSDYDPDTEEAVVDQGYSDYSSAIIPHISDSQMAPVWQVSCPSVTVYSPRGRDSHDMSLVRGGVRCVVNDRSCHQPLSH